MRLNDVDLSTLDASHLANVADALTILGQVLGGLVCQPRFIGKEGAWTSDPNTAGAILCDLESEIGKLVDRIGDRLREIRPTLQGDHRKAAVRHLLRNEADHFECSTEAAERALALIDALADAGGK